MYGSANGRRRRERQKALGWSTTSTRLASEGTKPYARKEADAYSTIAVVEVRSGTYTPDSQSVAVARAAELRLASCSNLERTTVDFYRAHVTLHINPYLGRTKLSQLTAPMVREFEDDLRKGEPAPNEEVGKKRSIARVKRIIGSLGFMLADAQECGLIARNVVRDLRGSRKKGKERQAERHQKGRLKVGVATTRSRPS